MFIDKVYTGLDHSPAAFDLRGRILGPNGNNLQYIKTETGAVVQLRGSGSSTDPVHIMLQHARADKMSDARSLALNLVETVKNELQQWEANNGQTVTSAHIPISTPVPSANNVQESVNIASTALPGLGNAVAATSPVVVRPQTVLQLMPQQQYILNQDGSQLIPLISQGVPMSAPGNYTQLTTLPIAPGAIGSFSQGSVGNATQFVDANLQPVSVAQFRFSGVPNSMQTFLQNGLSLSQVSLANHDTTTVSYTSLLPVSSTVSTPSTGVVPSPTAQNVTGDKAQYQMQAGDHVQLAPSQTMYIPYQQLQEFTSGQNGTTLQPQLVSISGSGNVNSWPTATSMGLPQIAQVQPGTTLNPNILHLNQKQPSANTSVINIWSAQPGATSLPAQISSSPQIITPSGQVISGQPMQISASQGTTLTPIPNSTPWVRPPNIAAALPQGAELIPLNTPTGSKVATQESRGQKRLSDGTPSSNQIQLRPIAPAGSQTSGQDKTGVTRDGRWTLSSGNQLAAKGCSRSNSATNTSSSQTGSSSMTIIARDNTSSPARQGDKSSTQSQDSSKPSEIINKTQPLPNNIHMYALSNSAQGINNITPASIQNPNSQLSQMYIVPSSQAALQNLPPGAVQTLQVGQGNVPMVQSGQLSLPQGVQYNTVPIMHLPQQMQYITPGINFNNPNAQQFGLAMSGQQILSPAMMANMQQQNAQLAQLHSPSLQPIQSQIIPGSQTTNVQYSNPSQNIPQSAQFINPQQEVINSGPYANNQFATQQGNIILPGQGNVPQQYAPVSQIPAAQLNPAIPPSDARANTPNTSQPNTYPTTNTLNPTNANQSTTYQPGVPQNFPPGTAGPQLNQYPSAGSPNVNQIGMSGDASNANYPVAPGQNQENYPQSNTPSEAYASSNTGQNVPPGYAGNQYGAGRGWVGQRFPAPAGTVTQYNVAPRASTPVTGQSPAQAANNSNYWQYS